MIHKLGIDDLIASEPSRQCNLVMAMIVERLHAQETPGIGLDFGVAERIDPPLAG